MTGRDDRSTTGNIIGEPTTTDTQANYWKTRYKLLHARYAKLCEEVEASEDSSLQDWLKKHIALPINDDFTQGWNNAMQACLMFVRQPKPACSEISVVDETDLSHEIAEECLMKFDFDPDFSQGLKQWYQMARHIVEFLCPYLRTTEPVSVDQCPEPWCPHMGDTGSSKDRTADFESANLGSIPSPVTKEQPDADRYNNRSKIGSNYTNEQPDDCRAAFEAWEELFWLDSKKYPSAWQAWEAAWLNKPK